MKITKISQNGLNLIKQFEGFSSKPYEDVVGIFTIGYGSTYYENGAKVRSTDLPISESRATQLLLSTLVHFENSVDSFTRDDISQNKFDSLCSFVYNLGAQALKSSTLLKKVNANPDDPTIANEFAKWNKAGGKVVAGLTKRRKLESQLYFS